MVRTKLDPSREFRFFSDNDEFYSQAAIAPRSNCILDTGKLAATGVVMRPVREALQAALECWTPESC